jgi:cellulose synthase/poly-beta-1,6-N-acetylglucosamine synthase-like glycosyltransferase
MNCKSTGHQVQDDITSCTKVSMAYNVTHFFFQIHEILFKYLIGHDMSILFIPVTLIKIFLIREYLVKSFQKCK